MGHSAAFVKDNAGSDDDEVSLSTRSDAKPIDKVWGAISGGDKVIGSLAHLFEEGATVIHQLADPALFAHGMASFNGAALSHGRFLDKMQRAATHRAPPLPPPLPPPLYPGDEASYLDPSDDEEPAETAPAAAPVALPAQGRDTPLRGSPQTQPKACAPPKKKRKGSDSDELSDSDESSASGSDTSEEEDATSSSNDGTATTGDEPRRPQRPTGGQWGCP